jgi:Integrase core domain
MIVHRQTRCHPLRPNEAWTLDFVHDQLSSGQKFRMLTVVDVFSREALAIEVRQRLRGEHVVEALNRLVRHRGPPKYLFADNGAGAEGVRSTIYRQAGRYHHGVRIELATPPFGSPGPGSLRTTPISRRSTGRSGTNASTCIGSLRYPMAISLRLATSSRLMVFFGIEKSASISFLLALWLDVACSGQTAPPKRYVRNHALVQAAELAARPISKLCPNFL